MFSVPSSPYNSRARQIYGGWTDVAAPRDFRGDYQTLRGWYALNPAGWYRDSKWANMAIKYSPNREDLALAKLIKKAGKDQMKRWREDADWRAGYAAALASMRSPVVRRPLSNIEKYRLWATFGEIPFNNPTASDRAWLSLATKGPYTSVPRVDGINIEQEALDALSAGPLSLIPESRYRLPPAGQRGAWRINPAVVEAMNDNPDAGAPLGPPQGQIPREGV